MLHVHERQVPQELRKPRCLNVIKHTQSCPSASRGIKTTALIIKISINIITATAAHLIRGWIMHLPVTPRNKAASHISNMDWRLLLLGQPQLPSTRFLLALVSLLFLYSSNFVRYFFVPVCPCLSLHPFNPLFILPLRSTSEEGHWNLTTSVLLNPGLFVLLLFNYNFWKTLT